MKKRLRWVRVTTGRFACEQCGATWTGKWYGATDDMICPVCGGSLVRESLVEVPEPTDEETV